MSNRQRTYHGQKRGFRLSVPIAGTGAQSVSLDLKDAEFFVLATDACAATTLTIDLINIYEGASPVIYLDALHNCDCLTITAQGTAVLTKSDGSCGELTDIAACADVNIIDIQVYDTTVGAELVSVDFHTV